nr:O-antigen ligase family protein [Candidatus Levybacteria bacterium]
MKFLSFIKNKILFLLTLFLLIFIPLFPKIPLVDVKNTWVYIRPEDIVVLFILFFWVSLLFRKKINLKTPLTLPILIFWLVGAVSTLHGILLIFPLLANVFPNVAFLGLIRHMEYLSLFFVAYQGLSDKKFIPYAIATVVITLLAVIAYGFGQKYLSFPAFLTMNEEFAKGIPIHLSQLSRVPSTFAGHYDLAAYLVLVIPIVVSLAFGLKNLFIKFFLLITAFLGLILLFMTVSRISFFALIISFFIILFFQKRKLILLSIPILLASIILIVSFQSSLLNRFQSSVKEVDVLVDAKTGDSIGHVTFVKADYFKNKIVLSRKVKDKEELLKVMAGDKNNPSSTPTTVLPFKEIPKDVTLLIATNISTGESLSQGTGYINLPLSPVIKKPNNFFYQFPPDVKALTSADAILVRGDFVVKRAAAYDLSFTTRFQGEWPHALEAFERNVLLGSGYGSVSLAVDNNYLRMLGEIGILGFVSFLVIFLTLAIYIKKTWSHIDSNMSKSFILGFVAGLIGLSLNATLIDVFEASKIAFLLWLLMGIVFATLDFYKKSEINFLYELKKIAVSTPAIAIYLFALTLSLFSSTLNSFFVGDDFTWLRWAADGPSNILNYFTQSNGFFYRPGTKVYFYLMYHTFWLNQFTYHAVSLFLHFSITVILLIIAKKVFKNTLFATLAAFLFLIASGSTEMVYWISSTGSLFTAFFGLLGLLFFVYYEEQKKFNYYLLSFVFFSLALLFHELGIFLPLLIVSYKLKDNPLASIKNLLRRKDFLFLFVPVVIYLFVRFTANSHWLSGDYNYDFIKFPFNFVGNILGYMALTLMGPSALPFYEKIRSFTRENILLTLGMIPLVLLVAFFAYKKFKSLFDFEEKKIVIFGLSFFVVSLLPFVGLGNITSRYSYLASMGLIIIFVILIKKLYYFLLENGKNIALTSVSVLILFYSTLQIIQVQQTGFNWLGA